MYFSIESSWTLKTEQLLRRQPKINKDFYPFVIFVCFFFYYLFHIDLVFFLFKFFFFCVLKDFGANYIIGRVHPDKADDLLDHPLDSSVLTFNILYIETMHVLSLGELSFFFENI